MTTDPLDLYGRANQWTVSKVAGAAGQLDAATPCDEWTVRDLLNHMLETQRFFVSRARGEQADPPSSHPPALVGDDPVADFDRSRDEVLGTFGQDGVVDRMGPILGIAFTDQLLHGWDLAQATGQDATMPAGLPEAA